MPTNSTLKQVEEPNINETLTNLNQNTFSEFSQRSKDSISTHVQYNLDEETKITQEINKVGKEEVFFYLG